MRNSALLKNLSAKGRLGKSRAPLFILRPPYNSETNGASKLKFGTLVGICRYSGYM